MVKDTEEFILKGKDDIGSFANLITNCFCLFEVEKKLKRKNKK